MAIKLSNTGTHKHTQVEDNFTNASIGLKEVRVNEITDIRNKAMLQRREMGRISK